MRATTLVSCCLLLAGLAGFGAARADAGQKNYRLYCMGCHGADGSGSPVNGIPCMRGEVGHFLRVPEGRAYLSQVPGTLNTPLNDAETAELLNWVMKNIAGRSVPADFKPYTEADVKGYRATIPEDIPGLRVELVKRIEALAAAGSK